MTPIFLPHHCPSAQSFRTTSNLVQFYLVLFLLIHGEKVVRTLVSPLIGLPLPRLEILREPFSDFPARAVRGWAIGDFGMHR